jgi:hypothetical protein
LLERLKEKNKKSATPTAPVVKEKEPKTVIMTRSDGTKAFRLSDGVEVSEMHPKIKQSVIDAYKAYPETPKGVIEALLMKESTAGYNDKNRNNKIGKYAWLGGLTNISKEELKRLGYKPDFDTIGGAINSMTKFWNLKSKKGQTPVQVYDNEYSSGRLSKEDLKKFERMVEYYANN